MIANYGSQEAMDNDDGSGFWNTTSNVLVYGAYGQKADMAGHDNHHRDNLYAYLARVCYVDLGGGETSHLHRNSHMNNTCIQGPTATSYVGVNCKANDSWPQLAGNLIYNPSGTTSECGMSLQQWQSLKNGTHDPGTRVMKGYPSDAQVVEWAADTLGLGYGA